MKNTIILFLISFIIYNIISYYESYKFKEIYNINKIELLLKIKENKINNIAVMGQVYAEEKKSTLKTIVNLNVDFFPQSPFWKWWPIFNDTCEEASLLIAINYVRHNKMNRVAFRDKLLDIVDYENKIFWDYKHTDVSQTSKILKNYFKFFDYKIVDNPSIKYMKQVLNNWNIIIAPFYGIGLNPHYSGKWPEYHFMVIKGYNKTDFITHDVWTKYWADYKYNQLELYRRLHDYDSVSVMNWKKRIIVLTKN